MLPFALSRFIAAHFETPKREPEQSERWRRLHGHSLSSGIQAYVALRDMAGHDFVPGVEQGDAPPEKSATPFQAAVDRAQSMRSQRPLLEPFVGALELGRTGAGDPFYALVTLRTTRAAVAGWNPDAGALDRLVADDVTSFAALNFISAKVIRGGHNPASRTLKPLIGALDDRVAFPCPYDALEDRFAVDDLFPSEWVPDPSPLRYYQRCAYLMGMLAEGEFSMDAWATFDQPDPDPTKALKNIPRSPPTALYWMWRLFLESHDEPLPRVLEAALSSKAAWIVDAARIVAELRKGRRELGTIADMHALREEVSQTIRDPAKLAARRAAQRRGTVDKRIASMRVPSGLRFEPVAQVPQAPAADRNADLVMAPERGLALHTDAGARPLLPHEPGTEILDAVRLDGDCVAVLVEAPGESSTRRRLSLYRIGARVMRLGGHVFQDILGGSGLVRIGPNAVALWKEAVESERMFPWTGRTNVYGLIDGNFVSLGGATFDCVGACVVDGELFGLRADGSGYRAVGIDDAIRTQATINAGPRFAPIPLKEVEDQESWRDCFAPGPVTVESGALRWKAGLFTKSTPCPAHLRGELGVTISRDGAIAWLMTRTGRRIDRLDLSSGMLTKVCEWPEEEGWAVGVAEAGRDLVVASTWRIRVLKAGDHRELWSKEIHEAQSVAALPSRHFAVLNRGGSGPGLLTLYYVRDLDEAPDNESDAAGEWSSYGYAGEAMYLYSTADAIAVAGEKTRGILDPEIVDKVPHWARSRGWFDAPAESSTDAPAD